MFCPRCGYPSDDKTGICPACGASLSYENNPSMGMASSMDVSAPKAAHYPVRGPQPAYVPNHLVGAILVTLFCCLPFGIVSIVYASSVNGKLAAGDFEGARSASSTASTWMWVSFGLGLAVQLIWFLFIGLAALADM